MANGINIKRNELSTAIITELNQFGQSIVYFENVNVQKKKEKRGYKCEYRENACKIIGNIDKPKQKIILEQKKRNIWNLKHFTMDKTANAPTNTTSTIRWH